MRARSPWALLFAACCPAIAFAALDPTDVVQIQASASLFHDNNLFRLPKDGIRDIESDTARILGVGLKYDKIISRQRLIADINLNDTTYDKNTNLDFTGGDGRVSWLWQVGNLWNGEASYRKRRELGGFEDIRLKVQDLIDTDTYTINGGYQFHPRWRISAEVSEQDSEHSSSTRQSLDYDAQALGMELRYRTPALNSIGLQARRTDRNYPNRLTVGFTTLDNGHRETRLNTVAAWQFTGATKLDAQVGHIDVQHDNLSQRDFSGATWRASASWDTTSKLRLSLNTWKDVRLYEDNLTSYIVVKAVEFSPVYTFTPKIVLQADLRFERRDYRGDPGFFSINLNREDDVRLGRVGVTYSPHRNVGLSLSYETGDRRSNIILNDYDYQAWFGTVRVGF